MTTFLVFLSLVLWFGWFALYRNAWVLRMRLGVLQHGMEEYDRLPSYETMLFKFWIWDVNKFLK